ncbi:hypothetical protein Tco_1492002 [Tanacetum coccineum]
MKELRLDDKLNFVEEPMEIMDREVKQLKQSCIPIVKVRWNSKRGPEFTWEREDQIRAKLASAAICQNGGVIWVVLLTFIDLMGSSAIITNQVALLLRWKRCSWRVIVRPKDRLGTGLFFYSIPSFFFSERAEAELSELIKLPAVNPTYVVVKDLNQKPFIGILSSHSAAFLVREKWKNLNLDVSFVAPSACVGSLVPVLLEEDASSSKRFLPVIVRDSF